MQPSIAQDNYLVTEVTTATPQKLQLLLVEAALRLANRTRQYWRDGRDDLAIASLVRAQEIVAQMLAVLDYQGGGELVKRVAAVYEFIFRSLVQAGHRHSEKNLDEAVRILEIERETWRQLCETVATNAPHANFETAARNAAPLVSDDAALCSEPGAFSIEA